MNVGFASSPSLIDHDTGPRHPERPDRLRAIHRALSLAALLPNPDPFPDFKLDLGEMKRYEKPLIEIPFQPADLKWLHAIHSARYVDHVRWVSAMGGVLDQGDTPTSPDSFDTALLALGALLACCDWVMAASKRRAFAAIRPPGHHAEPERPMGFCLFSNVSIAARYLQQHHNLKKIAIVDFDVHHGNGTQACFYDDPTVHYSSLHQHPRTCYPGTGFEWEIGVGPGRGYTLNVPMQPGSGDNQWLGALEKQVIPALDQFKPEFLIISAGFDAHQDDPLAQCEVSEEGFEKMTRLLVSLADRHAQGRVVSALEGGYSLRALGRSAVRHITALM